MLFITTTIVVEEWGTHYYSFSISSTRDFLAESSTLGEIATAAAANWATVAVTVAAGKCGSHARFADEECLLSLFVFVFLVASLVSSVWAALEAKG